MRDLTFEARSLRPYAEYCENADLREGAVYFSVLYCDQDLLVPEMEALVFIGRDLAEGDTDTMYFQDVDSYASGVRFGAAHDGDAELVVTRRLGPVSGVYEYERALEDLMRCALRRRERAHAP